MTDQITVGYDGSDSSSEAVLWSAQEAVTRRAPLHIVACWDDMASLAAGAAAFPEAGAVLSSRQAMETVLGRMVGAVEQSHPDLKLTAATEPGPAFSVLMDRVSIDGLLVVGASSHHGAGAFWLGSTARHLVHHAPCPVVVIRVRRVVVGRTASSSAGPRRRIGRCGGRPTRPTSTRSSSPSSTVGGTRTRRERTPPSRLAISHGSTPPACSRRRSAWLGIAAEPW